MGKRGVRTLNRKIMLHVTVVDRTFLNLAGPAKEIITQQELLTLPDFFTVHCVFFYLFFVFQFLLTCVYNNIYKHSCLFIYAKLPRDCIDFSITIKVVWVALSINILVV